MNSKRIFARILCGVMGVALLVLGCMEIIDAFWGGMGTALVVVNILALVRMYRFQKDEAYREKVEVEANDERNRFLRSSAWAWAGYLFILITAVAAIVLRVVGQEVLSIAAGFAVCLLMLLYWGADLVLRKKY